MTSDPSAAANASIRPLARIAVAALVAGVAYYAAFRGADPAFLHDPTLGTFPSLVHGFATTLLLLVATGRNRRRAALAVGANLVLTAALERTLGTFDPLDLAALALGTLAAAALARAAGAAARDGARRIAVPGLLIVSAVLTMASGEEEDPRFADGQRGEPVYLSYAALREAVRVAEPRELDDIGRLYLYEDLLLLNARNEGVHVIDNADPANPVPLAFVEIPGNTELAIRDGVLYADSYVDLVAIELASVEGELQVVAREEDVFPWDPRQNVPDDASFRTPPDEALGVVVGIDVGGTVLVDLPDGLRTSPQEHRR